MRRGRSVSRDLIAGSGLPWSSCWNIALRFSQLLSRRALARSSVDNNFGGFLVAHLARVDDKMVLMRIRNIYAEVAADILLTNAVGSFDVFGGLLFT